MTNEPINEPEESDVSQMLAADPELLAMQAEITAIDSAVTDFESSIGLDPIKEEAAELERQAREAEAAYRKIQEAMLAKKREVEELTWQSRAKMLQFKRDKESMERRYVEMHKAKAIQAQFATLEARWDKLTMGAKWREWAKDHQLEAARRITRSNKMILADTMGLGKTLSSIVALDLIKAATKDATPESPFGGEEVKSRQYNYTINDWEEVTTIEGGINKPCGLKVLYFCPSTMMRNVEREVREWAPHRSVVILGGLSKMQRQFVLDVATSQAEYIVVVNYEAWRKDKALIESLAGLEFDTAIIDEAHNIKDMKSSAYRGVKQILDNAQIPFVVPMTGTPILNKPEELFTLLTLVAPDRFYRLQNYLLDYCQQDLDTGKWRFRPGGLDALAKKISHLYLRRTKDQAGIQLPPKTINVHTIEVDEELYPNQARARNEMRQYAAIMLDPEQGKAIQAAAAIAVYTRLRQIETWPAGIKVVEPKTKEIILQVDIEESQKIDYVIKYDWDDKDYVGLLPEVVTDERVVVFSQFTEPLREISRRLDKAGISNIILDGHTPDDLRNEIATNFDARHNEEPKWQVVLCNYRVGGVGLNFTQATQMIILDEEWNPGKRDQAYDRIHRIGQDKPVTIHVLRDTLPPSPLNPKGGGGIDVWLAEIIEDKERIVDGFDTAMDLAAMGLDAIKSGLI
jgi:SNF2 family DNA or RNA helicase